MKGFIHICCLLLSVPIAGLGGVVGPLQKFERHLGPKAFPKTVTISGYTEAIRYITQPPSSPEYNILAEISSEEPISNLSVSLEQGEPGTPSFMRVTLLSAPTLSGSTKLPSIVIGAKDFAARISIAGEIIRNGQSFRIINESLSLSSFFVEKPGR